ncbi:MAG: reverse transcriptase domain-containing protein [Patescibacteria group bacterium]
MVPANSGQAKIILSECCSWIRLSFKQENHFYWRSVMFFKTFLQDLPGKPEYKYIRYRDVNPLGGTTKIRNIGMPNEAMKIIQLRLLKFVRNLPVTLHHAMAFRNGCSAVNNVMIHRKRRYFYIFDIFNAYRHVDLQKLAKIICELDPELSGQEEDVYEFLFQYCQDPSGGLVIGANASQDLFNLYAGILIDVPLALLCKQYSLTYTRYSDDLIFSAKKVPIGWRKRKAIRQVVIDAGFKIQHRKAQVLDLIKGPAVINGIGIHRNGDLYVPRHYLTRLRGLIHRAKKEPELAFVAHGMMGIFWSFTKKSSLNQTEKKVVKEYRDLQKMLKRIKTH